MDRALLRAPAPANRRGTAQPRARFRGADAQCQAGQYCHALSTVRGPWVRRCVPAGLRGEGERCYTVPSTQEKACRAGLQCAGRGWCGRACQLGHSSCPDGFFCAALEPEPSCLPTCEERGCPPGQDCMRSEEDGASVCAVVHETNCQRFPCPEGQKCEDYLAPQRPGEAGLRCVQDCGPEHSPVPREASATEAGVSASAILNSPGIAVWATPACNSPRTHRGSAGLSGSARTDPSL